MAITPPTMQWLLAGFDGCSRGGPLGLLCFNKEPRHLIRFPINLEEASEEERKRIQLLRRPKQKLNLEEDKGGKFDPRKYVKF